MDQQYVPQQARCCEVQGFTRRPGQPWTMNKTYKQDWDYRQWVALKVNRTVAWMCVAQRVHIDVGRIKVTVNVSKNVFPATFQF